MVNNPKGDLYVGSGVKMTGNVVAPGLVEIDGSFDGVIKAQSESSAKAEVAVDDKASVTAEIFDIEKYVEQSASCVQQRPCIQTQAEESSLAPNVVNEPKKPEPAKVIEQAKPADSVIDRKAVSVESGGIQRVDRRRTAPIRVEVPPDMPR